ncbi:response regulator transcription factor [Paenibacillus sp. NPDC056722]|uniref:response regulator transcription factor n=1 Tax=Paenibacillus sp. NPDC056722 TaxID=3345924 RepID=UPI00368D9855
MARILAVDDEAGILILIRNILIKDGHSVTTLSEPEQITALNPGFFDLILLDVMMPGIDGFSLCERIRGIVDCPILFLTAKTLEDDIMYGLGLGADDYILKPFGTGELRARVNAHLRREQRERRSMLSIDEVHFNLLGKEMHVQEDKVPLTKSEYKICEFLARNRGQVFSKERIYESVFGFDGESDSAAVAEHVKNIRAKLSRYELSPIETLWGIGYKWRT